MEKPKPLFIWAGGKSKMIKHYQPFFPPINSYTRYAEPFFGGGAMFLYIKSKQPDIECYINDVNPDIIRIYTSVKTDLDSFIEIVNDLESQFIPLSYDERKKFYFDLREAHAWDYTKWSSTHESAVLYFLMRTSFNGVFQINKNTNNRFGTPAGLLNQTDRVYEKENVIHWNRLLQSCNITSLDWKSSIALIPDSTFFFFDPPYRGSFTSYGQSFSDQDQIDLLESCKLLSINNKVFLSNRDLGDGFWENRKEFLHMRYFNVTYTAGRRKKTDAGFAAKPAREVLLFNHVNKSLDTIL